MTDRATVELEQLPGPPHHVPGQAVLASVGSVAHGLSGAEAEARLSRWGPNVVPSARLPNVFTVFVRQFASPLIYVLLIATGLSVWLAEWADVFFIAAVLLLNAIIGAAQEWRAQRSSEALRRLVTTRASTLRDGELTEIDATRLVVGDIVLLESGDKVPADLRLLYTRDLQVEESALTGESLAVEKDGQAEVALSAALGDRRTMAYAGTLVTYGRGQGVVTATGANTEIGRLAGQLAEPGLAEPPLLTRMRRFTMVVGIAVGVVSAAVGAILLIRGTAWHDVVFVAVALAVSAIPEGLPVALTVALAVAVNRMARRNVIVRRLVAIESLGSCTVIASDKTGTLTVNELTATDIVVPGSEPWEVTGVGIEPTGTLVIPDGESEAQLAAAERLAYAGVLCNEASLARSEDGWTHRGDPLDLALLVLGHKLGVTRHEALESRPLLDRIPFESERRYAASLHAIDADKVEIVAKGAIESILPTCEWAATTEGRRRLDAAAIMHAAERLAVDGRRVIALATRVVRRHAGDNLDPEMLHKMTLLGLVGMIDPLRPEAPASVATCQRAGIRVVTVTGDHPATALAIAGDLDLAHDAADVVSGAQLADATAAGPEMIDALTSRASVFARVEPAQKLTIVESLSRQGEVVAVTGDGANDAPALHHAHVGVAMGGAGTDVAREAAELVLTDDRFSSITAGVDEGRVAYGNVRKVVLLLVSTGAAELVLILAALAGNLPLPLLAVQLLWLNLVTNGIQDVALAVEPAEGDEMRRPPRDPREPMFNRIMVERVLLSAIVIGGVTLAAYHWLLTQGWTEQGARNSAVLLLVLFENIQALNARSELRSVFTLDPRRNKLLLGGIVGAQLVHIIAMHAAPTQAILELQPVGVGHWMALLALALVLLVAVEIHKAFWRRLTTNASAAAVRVGGADPTAKSGAVGAR